MKANNAAPYIGGISNKMMRAGTAVSSPKALPLTLLIIFLSFSTAGANFPVDASPEIVLEQPFQASADMPKHFSSGSEITFEASADPGFHENADGFELQRKKANESSWTDWESQNIQSQWRHRTSSGDADYPAWTYFPDKTDQEVTLNEGESLTVTCDGQEVQFAANSITDSSPGETTLEVAGITYNLYEGEYIEPGPCPPTRVEEIGNFPYVNLQLYEKTLSPSDGNYEYRPVISDTSGDSYYGEDIVFDVSDLNNRNIPYIEDVSVDGQTLHDFQDASGISPGSTVTVDVIEREGDSYTVTLEDRRSGVLFEKIQRQNINEDGDLEDAYSLVLDFFIDPFVDTAGLKGDNSKRLVFKLTPSEREAGSDLFDQDGTFDFGFEISNDGWRNTADYTLTTDGTAYSPNITDVEGSEDCSTYSPLTGFDSYRPLECIRVTATDQNDEQLFVAMNLTEVYDGIDRNSYSTLSANFDERNGDQYIFNLSNIDVPTDSVNASGDWRAEFIASDGITNDTETVTWSVPWGDLRVERVQPSSVPFSVLDNETFSNSYRIACSGGPECVNQNESVTLNWDPKPVDNLLGGLQ